MTIERGDSHLIVVLAAIGAGLCLVFGGVAVASQLFGISTGLPVTGTGATLVLLVPLFWFCARHAEESGTAFATICLEVAAGSLVVATYTNHQELPTVLAFLVSTVGLLVRTGLFL